MVKGWEYGMKAHISSDAQNLRWPISLAVTNFETPYITLKRNSIKISYLAFSIVVPKLLNFANSLVWSYLLDFQNHIG